jgi:hypothetical protein
MRTAPPAATRHRWRRLVGGPSPARGFPSSHKRGGCHIRDHNGDSGGKSCLKIVTGTVSVGHVDLGGQRDYRRRDPGAGRGLYLGHQQSPPGTSRHDPGDAKRQEETSPKTAAGCSTVYCILPQPTGPWGGLFNFQRPVSTITWHETPSRHAKSHPALLGTNPGRPSYNGRYQHAKTHRRPGSRS